jgi:hypothetical protein
MDYSARAANPPRSLPPAGNKRPNAISRACASTWARVLLAAIIVILIVLIAIASPRVRDYERFLSGFWSGDPAFLEESGLSEMYLYISPSERSGGCWRRQGYLVMVDAGGGMVSNQGIEIEYSGAAGRWKSALKSHFSASSEEVYRVKRASFSYDDEEVMPTEMHLGLNTTQGSISLYTGDKLFAFLYKDSEVSASANAAYCDTGAMPHGS